MAPFRIDAVSSISCIKVETPRNYVPQKKKKVGFLLTDNFEIQYYNERYNKGRFEKGFIFLGNEKGVFGY